MIDLLVVPGAPDHEEARRNRWRRLVRLRGAVRKTSLQKRLQRSRQ